MTVMAGSMAAGGHAWLEQLRAHIFIYKQKAETERETKGANWKWLVFQISLFSVTHLLQQRPYLLILSSSSNLGPSIQDYVTPEAFLLPT